MKRLFMISLLFVGAVSLNAQTKFGVKAGINISNITGDEIEDTKSKVGFYGGGYANIRFSGQFAFQPELLFSLQGAKVDDPAVKGEINLSYISVPLMMKWYAYEGLNFEFGPQIGLNVGAKAKAGGEEEDMKDFISSTDFGLNIGAGYELSMGLNFGIRYGLGLSKVIEDVKSKNSVISLGIGYSF